MAMGIEASGHGFGIVRETSLSLERMVSTNSNWFAMRDNLCVHRRIS